MSENPSPLSDAEQTTPTPSGRRSMRRLLPMLGVGNLAVFAFYLGIGAVLLPLQVQALTPGDEQAAVANLGVVSGIAAVFGTVFNPIGGALSDRTRSRWGRRNPWILGGAVAGFLLVFVLGYADSLLMIVIGWCLAQGAMNLHQAALTAVIPDRVSPGMRGTAAAFMGVALSLAGVVGTGLASLFTARLPIGYIVLGGLVVAVAVLMTTLTHDPRGDELPERGAVASASPAAAFGRFLSALSHRNFALVFVGRALLFLGYFLILGFQFYLFDYFIELPAGMEPAAAVTVFTMVTAVGTIVVTAVGGPLSDRLDRRRLFALVAGSASALAMLIPYFAPTWGGMLVFAVVNGGAFGCFMAVDTALATLVLPNDADAARDMGVLNIAAAGPQIIAPFIASAIILHLGGYGSLFLVGSAVGLLGALALVFVRGVR
ncbi:MFS transporter [Nocardiopsis sp. NRRL B-16309]|uniref:MFS transporter n=1 Tax=Nocardiopsis sp. NRRL B-16309 TaxID=1519494 RepID=UPI0006AEBD1A|nr:MFS transporter [Nocardiopsis sp. NRRL B-16309]KOX18286.1 MFS transporter [Nocardiopsis sp. NRRL B-16309]